MEIIKSVIPKPRSEMDYKSHLGTFAYYLGELRNIDLKRADEEFQPLFFKVKIYAFGIIKYEEESEPILSKRKYTKEILAIFPEFKEALNEQ